MTYREALRYLDSFINYERRDDYDYKKSFSLDRMQAFVSLLGDPHKGIRALHVAGTKGKGSTAAMIHSILKASGFKTGLYTSPHLISFRERIRIGDTLISEEDVARLLGKLRSVVDKLGDNDLSFFELYTALAYLYFKEEKVDFAVYEVGLGGRLDATNVIEPLTAVITPLSYEHTDKLGKTLGEIACEKAGIIKEGGICVLAPQDKEALDVIDGVAKEKKARLVMVGRDILYEELGAGNGREVFNVSGLFEEYPRLETGLLGSHQIVNAATAIGAVEALKFNGITIPGEYIRKGIKDVQWPGRFEIVARAPYIVLDGAQNRASANALARAAKRLLRYRNLILVLGISKDKDISGILDELLPISDSIILTRARVAERAAEPSKIKELIKTADKDIFLTKGVEEALDKARSIADPEDAILVTGSLFVVGEAKVEYAKS